MSGAVTLDRPQAGLHYEVDERSRPEIPMILLHGFMGSCQSMRDFAALLGDRRCLRPDLPGHGRSLFSETSHLYAMGHCVQALRRLSEALDFRKAHWLGYSMGARVALTLACEFPDAVASLVLLGGTAGISNPGARMQRQLQDEARAQQIEAKGLSEFVKEWEALSLFANQEQRLSPEQWHGQRDQRLSNSPEGLAASLRGMGTGSMPLLGSERLAKISAPVLLMAGDEDSKFCRLGKSLSNAIPRARFCAVKNAGHAPHLEEPKATADAICSFWDASERLRANDSF